MKWYLALNEAGTRGDIGLHTRLAVLSAKKHTNLEPTLLYTGERNDFTVWLESRGVNVVQSELPYLSTITDLVKENKYTMGTVGHWLRTNVCLEEMQDELILYTDIDVLFLKQPTLSELKPSYFAAAPEFDRHSWNYFNAGVMLVNGPGLRSDYVEFEKFVVDKIKEKTYAFNDQQAYNQFYRRRWDKLPLEMNWKPYWGLNDNATLVHFHGPKLGGTMQAIVEDKWNWESNHGRQIGSMFLGFIDSYLESFKSIREYLPELPSDQADRLNELFVKAESYDVSQRKDMINLDFMNFRMFPEGE